MGQARAGMRIYHIRPIPFNFLNGTRMRFILNKWGGVGMGATHPELTPLPSLHMLKQQKGIFVPIHHKDFITSLYKLGTH